MTPPGPQVEDGNYTRIHNDILDAITRGKFTVYEYKCLLFLLRMTYGWQKKEDAISLKQWEDGTGITKRHVARTLKTLEKKNVVYRKGGARGRGKTAVYGFNKYIDTWSEKVPERVPITKVPKRVPFSEEKVPLQGTEKVPVEVPTKEKKESKQASLPLGDYFRLYLNLVTPANQMFLTGMEQDAIGKLAPLVSIDEWRIACEKTGRKERTDPLAYIKTIVMGKNGAETTTSTVGFSMKELRQ